MSLEFHKLINERKTILLPDIGTFFNNDTKLAIKMVNQLHKYNIEIIKGEILHDPEICLNYDHNETYYDKKNKKFLTENYRKLIERKIVKLESYREIFNHAKSLNKLLVLSVYDKKGADFALSIKCDALKIASQNITNIPLIKYISNLKTTVILDTGHSTIEEIARAINLLNDNNCFDIFIQHSPKAPPVTVKEHNLKFMKTLGNTFGLPYGLSDHHNGDEMLYAATALGASIVEKGVTPLKNLNDQDCAHAMYIDEIPDILRRIKNISEALGTGTRYLRRDRQKYNARMCIYASEAIKAGSKLTNKNISYALPYVGIGVEEVDNIIGRKASQNIPQGEPIQNKHLI